MKLWFVRHAVTLENLHYILLGHTDPTLHPFGVKQAQHLGRRLARERLSVIATSPLCRAVQTAQAIQQAQSRALDANTVTKGLSPSSGVDAHPLSPMIQVAQGLREINLGIVDGMSSFKAYDTHTEWLNQALDASTQDFAFPNGELRSAALHRFETALAQVMRDAKSGLSNQANAHPCLVTHGGMIGLWLAHQQGLPLGRFREFQPRHASLTLVEVGWQTKRVIDNAKALELRNILMFSDTSHLPKDLQGAIQKFQEGRGN